MRIAVQPSELERAAVVLAADAATVEVLMVVARLEAAAGAVSGTVLAAAAQAAADRLRGALFQARLRLGASAQALDAAAHSYRAADNGDNATVGGTG